MLNGLAAEGAQTNDHFRNKLGWVREMYAYSLAAVIEGVPHDVQKRLESVLIAQPPADDKLVRAPPPSLPPQSVPWPSRRGLRMAP